MRTTRVKTLIVAPMIGVGLLFGTAACGNPVQSTPIQGESRECDEDDWEEGDDPDCEGLSGPNAVDEDNDSHKVKKSKTKKKTIFGTNKGGSKKNSGFGRSKPRGKR